MMDLQSWPTVIVGIFAIGFIWLLRYMRKNDDYWSKRGVHHAPRTSIFFTIWKFCTTPVHEIISDAYKKYGKVYGFGRVILPFDGAKQSKFPKATNIYIFSDVFCFSLRRKLVLPGSNLSMPCEQFLFKYVIKCVTNGIDSFESIVKDENYANWTGCGYVMNQGVLYRYTSDTASEEAQLVVPRQDRERILKEYHDAPIPVYHQRLVTMELREHISRSLNIIIGSE